MPHGFTRFCSPPHLPHGAIEMRVGLTVGFKRPVVNLALSGNAASAGCAKTDFLPYKPRK